MFRGLARGRKDKMVVARAKRIRPARRTTTWADLERVEGVFLEILSRLPPQSLRSFRALNKHWNGAITSRFFLEQQLARSLERPSFITCPNMDSPMVLYSMKPGSFGRSRLNTIAPAEKDQGESMYMISSFNGLICCVNQVSEEHVANQYSDLQIWIVNPCTGETLLLPQGTPSFQFEPSVGVAYSSAEYKVFRIFCAGRKVPEEKVFHRYDFVDGELVMVHRYTLVYECEVYSSITGVWENIGPVPCVPVSRLSPYRCVHVFVGGKVYWLSSFDHEGGDILCVDYEGRFEVVKLPPYEGNQHGEDMITEATYLVNLQGRLSVVILHPEDIDIWVRKGSGENGTWILERACYHKIDDTDMVLAMTSLGNEIICVTETKWCSYNMNTGKWKKGRKHPGGFVNHPTVYPFSGSFLRCTGML